MLKYSSLIIIIILTSFSCSSDDSNQKTDLLIGTWKPIRIEQHIFLQNPPITYLNECEQKSRYQFNADGTITQWKIHSLNSSNECVIKTALISGKWLRTTNYLNFGDAFFELTLLNNETNTTYIANDYYDASVFNNGELELRTEIEGDYIYLERVE